MLNVDLLTPIKIGDHALSNRMVMAPMTRLRAVGSIPTPVMADYYAQRASAGLIVTECTMTSPFHRTNHRLATSDRGSASQGWQNFLATMA